MPLARANSVSVIGGRKVCNLTWPPSTTMRENQHLLVSRCCKTLLIGQYTFRPPLRTHVTSLGLTLSHFSSLVVLQHSIEPPFIQLPWQIQFFSLFQLRNCTSCSYIWVCNKQWGWDTYLCIASNILRTIRGECC